MILKDILPDRPLDEIMVRASWKDTDILIGFCRWTGRELQPLDGDNYDLYDEIERFEFDKDGNLTYWEACDIE